MLLFSLLKINICNETRNKLKFTRALCVLTMWIQHLLQTGYKHVQLYTTTVVYRPRFIRHGYSYSPQFAYNIIEVMYNDVCITLVTGVIIPFVTVNGHECTTCMFCSQVCTSSHRNPYSGIPCKADTHTPIRRRFGAWHNQTLPTKWNYNSPSCPVSYHHSRWQW